MSEKILKATHQGTLKIGDKELPCAVLDDGTRILSQTAIFDAFGRPQRGRMKQRSGEIEIPSFIDAGNLQPFIDNHLRDQIKVVEYTNLNGRKSTGYRAEALPLICDVYLTARERKALTTRQLPLAVASEIIVRSLSKIGIIALVDEATGYQDIRDRQALQKILEMYIAKELRPWIKTFPNEFYENLFRLRGWQYKPLTVKRPGVVGRITNDLVYKRLAPNILEELQKVTPRDEKGRTKHRYHQHLTEDIGHPKLREHLASVITLMKAAPNWPTFYRLIQRALPQYGETLELPFSDIEIEKLDQQ